MSTLEEKFWKRVDRRADDECWLWTGTTDKGYGRLRDVVAGKTLAAHRLSVLFSGRTIPPGMHVDHLCRVTNCVNPRHLEVVTPRENTIRGISPYAVNARKTHCDSGHEFTPENTYYGKARPGQRQCVTCRKENDHRHYLENRERRLIEALSLLDMGFLA